MNARKHGVLMSDALLRSTLASEERRLAKTLRADLITDLQPSGAHEELLIEDLVVLRIRWLRLRRHEGAVVAEQLDHAESQWWTKELDWYEVVRERDESRGLTQPLPPVPSEDLRMSIRSAQRLKRALSSEEPRVEDWSITFALLHEAERFGLSVDDVEEDLEPHRFDALEPAEKKRIASLLLRRIAERNGYDAKKVWARLRLDTEKKLRRLRLELRSRQPGEERRAALSGLPIGSRLDAILRYEAQLERSMSRILRHFFPFGRA